MIVKMVFYSPRFLGYPALLRVDDHDLGGLSAFRFALFESTMVKRLFRENDYPAHTGVHRNAAQQLSLNLLRLLLTLNQTFF